MDSGFYSSASLVHFSSLRDCASKCVLAIHHFFLDFFLPFFFDRRYRSASRRPSQSERDVPPSLSSERSISYSPDNKKRKLSSDETLACSKISSKGKT